jgi:adenylate cyclase
VLEPIAGSQDRRLILGEAPRALLAASYAAVGRIEDASAEVEALVQQIPYVNLSHFRLFYQLHARAEDIEHRIDALRRAGMSDWPFGFDGDPEQRLTGTILEDLISGRTWTGTDSTGGSGDGQFNARFDRQGRVAYFSQSTSAIGTAFVRGEELCEQYDLLYWGRPSCGPVYRNLEGTVEDRNEYVYVNAGMVRYFSTPE